MDARFVGDAVVFVRCQLVAVNDPFNRGFAVVDEFVGFKRNAGQGNVAVVLNLNSGREIRRGTNPLASI